MLQSRNTNILLLPAHTPQNTHSLSVRTLLKIFITFLLDREPVAIEIFERSGSWQRVSEINDNMT